MVRIRETHCRRVGRNKLQAHRHKSGPDGRRLRYSAARRARVVWCAAEGGYCQSGGATCAGVCARACGVGREQPARILRNHKAARHARACSVPPAQRHANVPNEPQQTLPCLPTMSIR